MAFKKQELVEKLAQSNGFMKKQAVQIVEDLLEIIKSTLESGDDVLVSGFGKFQVKKKSTRKGRNPATGDDMMLGARTVVTFKCSSKLRDKINKSKRSVNRK